MMPIRLTTTLVLAGLLAGSLAGVLAGCAHHVATRPETSAPALLVEGYPDRLSMADVGAHEVVVVINNNIKMLHAGMWAGARLLDPAGSYVATRGMNRSWPGANLPDYTRFQLEDGPQVKLYRFSLSPEAFARIAERVAKAGGTIPPFCAAKVRGVLSGIKPFQSVSDAFLATPAGLAEALDDILLAMPTAGRCQWPNGLSCHPFVEGVSSISNESGVSASR